MREGFAIYFNTLKFNPYDETLSHEENLVWLEAVKNLGPGALSSRFIFLADTVAANDLLAFGSAELFFSRDFQILSWALVSFFLNSGENEYFRTLTECFMVLSPEASTEENSRAVMNRLSLWIDFASLDMEVRAYLDSRKTFAELMENGRHALSEGNATSAEFSFLAALEQRPNHYEPYYYLALIYSREGLYGMAEEYYLISLEYGIEEAPVFYALGANAISAGRIIDGRYWLERAAALDPARYRPRLDELQRGFE
jgi:tetratricopeptide (TPR) repeat protein